MNRLLNPLLKQDPPLRAARDLRELPASVRFPDGLHLDDQLPPQGKDRKEFWAPQNSLEI